MRLIFIGPPGAGKGTQSNRLIDFLQVPHVSTGDMLRQEIKDRTEYGLRSQEYMAIGKLVPDPIILEIMGHRLDQRDCANGCLFDGFPRTLVQAQALDEFLARRGTPLDGVLELVVDKDELVRRTLARGREDDRPDIVRKRLDLFYKQTAPLSDYYRERGLLHAIPGTGSPDEVFDRIKLVLKKIAK
ncbi:MAG TPA: adenylate kinase [Pirellulales bacterium]|jgi:adenylate kinase|nr:adenylate kinase [Pirellulales bacterium]